MEPDLLRHETWDRGNLLAMEMSPDGDGKASLGVSDTRKEPSDRPNECWLSQRPAFSLDRLQTLSSVGAALPEASEPVDLTATPPRHRNVCASDLQAVRDH